MTTQEIMTQIMEIVEDGQDYTPTELAKQLVATMPEVMEAAHQLLIDQKLVMTTIVLLRKSDEVNA